MSGYSGTPLAKKIGIKDGHSVTLVNALAGFEKELGKLPDSIKLNGTNRRPLDVIMCFVTSRAALQKSLRHLPPKMATNGMLWLCWPKKASGVVPDLSENIIRDRGIAAGRVDI